MNDRYQQMTDQIENNFTFHNFVEGDGKSGKCEEIREFAKNLANLINDITPPSREQSLAITKLEEVVFWANASIARN